jgi:hypothetical protein
MQSVFSVLSRGVGAMVFATSTVCRQLFVTSQLFKLYSIGLEKTVSSGDFETRFDKHRS